MARNDRELNREEVETATRKLVEVVEEGLEHGFFEYSVTGEMLNDGARRITVKAGKSYRYTIHPKKDDKKL